MSALRHHESVYQTTNKNLNWWRRETGGVSPARCPRCWLRRRQCWCDFLVDRRHQYDELWKDFSEKLNIKLELVMYYHAIELGRSANTAHVFDYLCGAVTRSVVFADTSSEDQLLRDIFESPNDLQHTCLLYPCAEALSLDDWLRNCARDPLQNADGTNPCDALSAADRRLTLRLIVLDGTYAHARTMMKFVKAHKESLPADQARRLQFVQLDLDAKSGLQSAVAGVMYQPAKDKICSFQAIALAVRQVLCYLVSECNPLCTEEQLRFTIGLCDQLSADLQSWILHILAHKIKNGKETSRGSLIDVDNKIPDELRVLVKYKKDQLASKKRNARMQRRSMRRTEIPCDDPNFNSCLRIVPTFRYSVLELRREEARQPLISSQH